MSRARAGRLSTGVPAKGDDGTSLYSALAVVTAAPSGAPSGTLDAGTVACAGWEYLDLDLTVTTEAVDVALYRYIEASGTWVLATWFGFGGMLTVAVGSYGYSVACGGSDFLNLRFFSRGAGGTGVLTADATLSQASA